MNILSRIRPLFLSHWPSEKAEYVLCVDESGDRDLSKVDKNWPILSLFGVVISYQNYVALQERTNLLKKQLWPPDGTFEYEDGVKKVCFHSREMRRKTGPFSDKYLDNSRRVHMDTVLWDDILQVIEWQGISCIIDKAKLLTTYFFPSDPYKLAVTFMLERLVMNVKKPSFVLFEARGKEEDRALWKHVQTVLKNGTEFVEAREFQSKILEVGWHPKFNQEGKIVCGLEVADLCAYAFGAKYFRTTNMYAMKVWHKLVGYQQQSVKGRGYKIFP